MQTMKRLHSKGIILPIIIAIVALVVVGGLFVYGTSSDNSGQGVFGTVLNFFQDRENFRDIIVDDENDRLPDLEDTIPESKDENEEDLIACTADAKICPDGSGVGRVPPTCEFAPCPVSNDPAPSPTSDLKNLHAPCVTSEECDSSVRCVSYLGIEGQGGSTFSLW